MIYINCADFVLLSSESAGWMYGCLDHPPPSPPLKPRGHGEKPMVGLTFLGPPEGGWGGLDG